MDRNPWFRTLWLTVLTVAGFATPASAQTELKFDIPLTAKVEDGKLVGVEVTGLDKVKFLPGDELTLKFEGGGDFDAEFWSRRYTWEKTEKRGKKKIVTHTTKDADVTWRARWGAGIDGVFAFANGPDKKNDVVKIAVSKFATTKPIPINPKVVEVKLEFTVRPDPDRVVDRPPDVPAHATATPKQDAPPKIDALISHGAKLGKLVFVVSRPSGK